MKQELLLKPEHEEIKEIIQKAIGPKMTSLTPEEAKILIEKGLGRSFENSLLIRKFLSLIKHYVLVMIRYFNFIVVKSFICSRMDLTPTAWELRILKRLC